MPSSDGITGEGYFPQFWDAWQYDDKLWGLMITSNSQVVAYQPALFNEVGIDPVVRRPRARPNWTQMPKSWKRLMPTATSNVWGSCRRA